MANKKKIAVVGECMIELRPSITAAGYSNATIDAQIGYGGDTLNVATYLARQEVDVEYVMVLGDDPGCSSSYNSPTACTFRVSRLRCIGRKREPRLKRCTA